MSPQKRLAPRRTFDFLRRLTPRIEPYRFPLLLAGALMFLSVSIGLAFPLIVRELLDAAFLDGNGELLNRIALGLLSLFVVLAIVNFSQSYLTASVSERVVADLRRDLFGSLIVQSPGFFAKKRVGEFSSRLASDSGLIQGVLRFGVPEIIRQATFLVGALVLVTITHPRLTLVTLTVIPFAALVGWFFGRRVRNLSTHIQDRLADAVARAEQVFTQIRIVQSFTREGYETEAYGQAVNWARDEGLRRAVARASLTGAVTFAAFGAIVMVLWEGGRLVLAGELTPGTLVAFLLYAVTISGAITSLAGFWGNIQEAAGAAKRVFELLDHPIAIESPTCPRLLPKPSKGIIRYEDVTFRYGSDLPKILDGIDVKLEAGSTVALVGSSGSGKSTLASLIPRFFDVEDGSVTFDGIDVRELALEELRGMIGIVPQEPMLFGGTIRENFAYGNLHATQVEIEAAAQAAHAHSFITDLPDRYDQTVGERGVTLSAGQRQRIAIARVILQRPKVLILDEASSSLDSESEALVQDALEHLMHDRTTLVIAHRLSTVIRADRILVLDQGRIVDQGSHLDLLDRNDVYDRLYRRQLHGVFAS